MKAKSWYEKIFFKYRYLGTVNKNGQPFAKYEKLPRFRNRQQLTLVIFFLVMVVSVLVMFSIMILDNLRKKANDKDYQPIINQGYR